MEKLFLICIALRGVAALIAYDCGHEKINKTTISLLNVESCKIEPSKIVQEEEDIQLLELNEVASIHIFQCKINVIQQVYYCGMFSHLSLVPGGLSTFIVDVTQEECMKIHKFGTYQLQNNRIIANIKANASTRCTETIAGSVDTNGKCQGTAYTYGTNSWTDVIVVHAMEFTITDYTGTVHLENNQVILRNDILCPYIKGKCVDPEFGMSFWDMIPDTSCESLSYTVLYQGNATKAQNLDIAKQQTHIIYTVSTGDVIFALEVVKPISVCRYNGFQTEHPRLVIVQRTGRDYWFSKKPANAKNLDLFTYVNAKFVYVERHVKTQIRTLYSYLMHKRCEVEREVLKTQLAVAHLHPSEFALMRMKEQGYTAVSRGEVVHLIKCQAVEIMIRKTEQCFNELPVSYNNQSYFMAPITHLLQEYGTEIPCSSILAPAYMLHSSWYAFSPHSHRIESPEALKPSKDIPWKYEDPHELIKSGIYSAETSDNLRHQIMYPSERQAIENVVAKSLMGHSIDHQNIDILNLFSSQHISEISSRLHTTWSLVTGFGHISASVLGIWIVIRIIKHIIGMLLNLRILSTWYSGNWRLLAATCDMFTTYLVHKETRRSQEKTDVQLTSVITNTDLERNIEEDSLENLSSPIAHTITTDTLRDQTRIYPALQK